jgi:hypothetical protein
MPLLPGPALPAPADWASITRARVAGAGPAVGAAIRLEAANTIESMSMEISSV